MSCKCIEKLNKQLEERPEKAKVELTFNGVGDVYPYMSAIYHKGKEKKERHLFLIPEFCPWCGKPYKRRQP